MENPKFLVGTFPHANWKEVRPLLFNSDTEYEEPTTPKKAKDDAFQANFWIRIDFSRKFYISNADEHKVGGSGYRVQLPKLLV